MASVEVVEFGSLVRHWLGTDENCYNSLHSVGSAAAWVVPVGYQDMVASELESPPIVIVEVGRS